MTRMLRAIARRKARTRERDRPADGEINQRVPLGWMVRPSTRAYRPLLRMRGNC